MRRTIGRFPPTRLLAAAASAAALAAVIAHPHRALKAQSAPAADAVPDLTGVWDCCTRRAHPINGPNVPGARSVPEGTMLPDGTLADKNYVRV